MLDTPPFTFRVIDLKQYSYCPRIFYYHTVLPQVRPLTYKMEAGITAHHTQETREKRRSLRTYGLSAGTRHFNLSLYSPQLNLSGELDMLIETDNELIPVDYKLSSKASPHFRLQLMAYAHILQESQITYAPKTHIVKKIKRGFLYLIPQRQAVAVNLTTPLKKKLLSALNDMKQIAMTQKMPAAPPSQRPCLDCEFRRFCNDVL